MSQPLAKLTMQRCDALAKISEESGQITRTFASSAMKRANRLVGSWMLSSGMTVREDAAFNLLGIWPSENKNAKTLLLGSHLDTVRNAGKYDGPLGVLTAIAAIELLRARGVRLPFHLEVVGFSDEEGVHYHSTYLGSRALAGTLTKADLAHVAEKQIVKARRKKNEFLGYAEVHIEQGPVLQTNDLPVGVVTAIAGQSRVQLEFFGVAGHAGTVPMNLRKDALVGAAEFVTEVSRIAAQTNGLVATVGKLSVAHGASNVIPGHVLLTLDVRHQMDAKRKTAVNQFQQLAKKIASRHGLRLEWKLVQQSAAVPCDKTLTHVFSQCVAKHGLEVLKLPSGAGHDAVALSEICPVAMLFVRCKDGISHNPAESVKTSDVASAIGVLADFVQTLATKHV
jgi:allantoate deiminase